MSIRALARGIPSSYVRATVRTPGTRLIDVARARAQHRAYVGALIALGVDVRVLPADEALPDCCFVEDQVVIAAGRGVVARSGNPARRGESAAVIRALQDQVELVEMRAPACLDGGDVLRIGERLYVGRSDRTNAAGIAALRHHLEPLGLEVRELVVHGALHLKCHCSAPAPGLVLVADGFLPPATFADVADVVVVPAAEAYAANTVGIGDVVLVAEGFPVTRRAIEARGHQVVPLAVDEIARGDGSLTCLSVFF